MNALSVRLGWASLVCRIPYNSIQFSVQALVKSDKVIRKAAPDKVAITLLSHVAHLPDPLTTPLCLLTKD